MTGGRLDRQVTGVRRLTDDKGDSLGQLTDNRCRTQVSRRTRVLCSEDRQVFLLIHKGYCWINNAQLVMWHVVGLLKLTNNHPIIHKVLVRKKGVRRRTIGQQVEAVKSHSFPYPVLSIHLLNYTSSSGIQSLSCRILFPRMTKFNRLPLAKL